MWSWTTWKMTRLNNRKFIGIELDENYFKIAQDRINAN
jgi:DNA modification methylase